MAAHHRGGSRSSGGGGGSSSTTVSYNITVTDKDGKPVTVTKSIGKDGNVTLTLPSGKLIDDGYYTIVIKDTKGNAKADVDVTLKDKKNGEMTSTTDKNGTVVIPTQIHNAYVYGYEDGEFKPEGNMTRAEAAAIFARNIAERKGETIPSKKSSFKDVNSKLWYSSPIAYLENYDVISGYSDGTFAPEEQITRAEFVAMVTRFYELFDKTTTQSKNSFADVATTHWAYKYINTASAMDWIAGYADSTFRPDNSITRAEVVAIVNRVTGRSADTEYINKNMSAVNIFTDLIDKSYWAFYEILEAANTHSVVISNGAEKWIR
ncbi:MAG: S-layer homology domain-containing protein [Clostridia bacterium]|nr:S-layer homology domain-containing protein [Clostridia bacterium]